MASIEIDRTKRLRDEPHTGHNRWHPGIAPILEVDEGEEVVLETRDALDGQFNANTTTADFAQLEAGPIHPLTGPVYIRGAQPGDLLETEFLDIAAEPWAFTAIIPGLGFLRDIFTDPFMVHWGHSRWMGHFGTDLGGANPWSSLHGGFRGGPLGCPTPGVDYAGK